MDIVSTSLPIKKRRERFWELDFIRGICVLLMIFDHAMQLMYLSDNLEMREKLYAYMNTSLQNNAQIIVRIIFFLLCGISCVFSRSNGKRGFQLLGVASTISLATILLDTTAHFSGVTIYFGVLHMLSIGILFCSILMVLSDSIPYVGKFLPMAVGVVCLILYYSYMQGKEGNMDFGYFPEILGYEIRRMVSADFAAIFPEMSYVLIGSGLGQFYKSRFRNVLRPLDGVWNKPVCFVGRHALVIYIIHPIVLGSIYAFC